MPALILCRRLDRICLGVQYIDIYHFYNNMCVLTPHAPSTHIYCTHHRIQIFISYTLHTQYQLQTLHRIINFCVYKCICVKRLQCNMFIASGQLLISVFTNTVHMYRHIIHRILWTIHTFSSLMYESEDGI